ncbi:MAG: uracil-DNA glycosylase family protein [Sphingomonas sp.]|uniref:uracil-DNA glycosylase family protein n=1 Tax=Sphingomonas sp. TaxID=28214 RepID=UPI000DB45C73|nr:IclR family transcriptional regulator [Zymomonas sp.]MBA4773727.1 uracil-DNA glycosylase family protein [Sphingomonas sp.]PZP09494.1 MAG: IclR family transcriptional regulator [Sphingomonas hengshuiensis]
MNTECPNAPAAADADALLRAISGCRVCADVLAAGPRPIVQFSVTARLVIIGQAPGTRVHDSGIPWDDASGARLREWTGLNDATFYDPARVALVPMGFCYPGTGASGDLPPRPECAPLWHDRVLALLPADRLTLLVGSHAQQYYLPQPKAVTMTERVRQVADLGPATLPPALFPLPHPSWRSTGWMRKNPWFEAGLLPRLRAAVRQAVTVG